MIKVYRAKTRLALPVLLDGKLNYVTFSDEHYGVSVKDEKIQEAIESGSYFKSGEIKLFEQIGAADKKEKLNPRFEEKEFPEVTGIQEAVEVLKGAPYLIASQSLRSPENVKKQAEANNVKFPNLKI
jgi:hypothetical protein